MYGYEPPVTDAGKSNMQINQNCSATNWIHRSLIIFLANAVIYLVSFSVNFTKLREDQTLSVAEVGDIRITADDQNASNSSTPDYLIEFCCAKSTLYSVVRVVRRTGRYCLGTVSASRYIHLPSDGSTLR
jgi:D-arabinose 1-dehydrogenase-like Zn-dependent alcohol dehydrogenase